MAGGVGQGVGRLVVGHGQNDRSGLVDEVSRRRVGLVDGRRAAHTVDGVAPVLDRHPGLQQLP